MSTRPIEKPILVIGDINLSVIGVAAGTDYYVFRGKCSELNNYLGSERVSKYGVFIIARNVFEKCKEMFKNIESADALVIIVDQPQALKKVDPKKYYEELIAKFIGMRIGV
ncbi:MAG: hypothetical protein ABWW65_03150 [Thermoprotei archaeon]